MQYNFLLCRFFTKLLSLQCCNLKISTPLLFVSLFNNIHILCGFCDGLQDNEKGRYTLTHRDAVTPGSKSHYFK
jgi:hypothetical protein